MRSCYDCSELLQGLKYLLPRFVAILNPKMRGSYKRVFGGMVSWLL